MGVVDSTAFRRLISLCDRAGALVIAVQRYLRVSMDPLVSHVVRPPGSNSCRAALYFAKVRPFILFFDAYNLVGHLADRYQVLPQTFSSDCD